MEVKTNHRTDHSRTHFRNPKIQWKKTREFSTGIINIEIFSTKKWSSTTKKFFNFSRRRNNYLFSGFFLRSRKYWNVRKCHHSLSKCLFQISRFFLIESSDSTGFQQWVREWSVLSPWWRDREHPSCKIENKKGLQYNDLMQYK